MLVAPVLKTMHGKKITKRIESEITKNVRCNIYVYYRIQFGMYKLTVKPNKDSDILIELLLSYDGIFDYHKFVCYNQCYFLHEQRIADINSILDKQVLKELAEERERLVSLIDDFNKKVKDNGLENQLIIRT